jgi:chromosome segregation ATPase
LACRVPAVEALSVRSEDVAKDLSERLKLEHEMASTHQQAEYFDRAVNIAQTSLLDKESALATLQSQERELDERIAAFRLISEAIDVPAVERKRDAIMTVKPHWTTPRMLQRTPAEHTGYPHSS